METNLLLPVIISVVAGAGLVLVIMGIRAKAQEKKNKDIVDEVIRRAKKEASEIKYHARKEAKEIAKEHKEEADREIARRQNDIKGQEKGLVKKEATLDQKIEDKNEWTKEKIIEKALTITSDKGPDGDFDD